MSKTTIHGRVEARTYPELLVAMCEAFRNHDKSKPEPDVLRAGASFQAEDEAKRFHAWLMSDEVFGLLAASAVTTGIVTGDPQNVSVHREGCGVWIRLESVFPKGPKA